MAMHNFKNVNEYLASCTKLLKEIHFPHIEIMSEESLTSMLFTNGPDRLEALKWMFGLINPEEDFTDNNLKEELLTFALNFGLCKQTEVKELILGGPEVPVKRQAEFWQQVLEMAKDVRNYNPDTQNHGLFLEELALKGTLEALANSVDTINICPAMLTSADLKRSNKSPSLQDKKDEQLASLEKLQGEVEALKEKKKAAPNSADLSTKMAELSTFLSDNKTVLEGLSGSLSKPAELDAADQKLKLSLEEAAISCQPAIKILEDQATLENLPKTFPALVLAPLDMPDLLKELENNTNDSA